MILLVMNSLFLEMLYFMKLFFLFLRKISLLLLLVLLILIQVVKILNLSPYYLLILCQMILQHQMLSTCQMILLPPLLLLILLLLDSPPKLNISLPIYKITTATFLLLLTPSFIKNNQPCFLYLLSSLMKTAALLTNNFVYLFLLLLNLKLLLRPANIIAGSPLCRKK